MDLIKRWTKHALKSLGYEIRRAPRQNQPIGRFPADPFAAQSALLAPFSEGPIRIFDIGANTGTTAMRYRKEFPEAEIHCFEPFPETASALRHRFAEDPATHIVECAVGRERTTASFYVSDQDKTNSLLPRPSSGRRYYPKTAAMKEVIEVEVVDLDSFCAEGNVPSPDIVKLDIQGGELPALEGARGLLESQSVSLVYSELLFVPLYEDAPLYSEICTLLQQFGFSLFNLYDIRHATNGQIRHADGLFVSDRVRKTVIDTYPQEP